MPSGSARDRRKHKRLRKQLGVDVAADKKKTTAPVQIVEKKKWNLWAIFLGVIAVIGFIAEIPSIRYNLQPHFQLETLQPVDKDNMYNFDHLLLKNTGILDISNAEVKCEPLINDTASHIFIGDLVVGSPPIPLLEAGGAGATIPCFFSTGSTSLSPGFSDEDYSAHEGYLWVQRVQKTLR